MLSSLRNSRIVREDNEILRCHQHQDCQEMIDSPEMLKRWLTYELDYKLWFWKYLPFVASIYYILALLRSNKGSTSSPTWKIRNGIFMYATNSLGYKFLEHNFGMSTKFFHGIHSIKAKNISEFICKFFYFIVIFLNFLANCKLASYWITHTFKVELYLFS